MRILLIGQLSGPFREASALAQKRGAKIRHAASVEVALHALRSGQGADLIFIEVHEPIARLVLQLAQERFHMAVIACGPVDDPALAVSAIEQGAKDYLPLPPDEEVIAAMLASLAGNDSAMIGSSPAFRKSLEIARQVAGSAASVLMMGESGTGKEVMARYIHQHSRRASGPFISINCAAIPSNLLESELFGHEKGAFTGAIARRVGKFEEAHQGTLLLDEITEMAPEVQAKLLRALQERVIDRVGGSQPIAIDIRVLATTNRSIVQAVRQGVFREDLYYRLNTIEMVLPPLRERQEDIVPLAEYFIDYYSRLNGLPLRALSPEVAVLLKHYPWPGNIRELENRMHRAVLLSSEAETITAGALGWDAVASNAEPWTDPTHWLTAQKSLTQAALAECSGDQKLASMLLGLSLRALASAE